MTDKVFCNDCKYLDFIAICKHPSTKHKYEAWWGSETHFGYAPKINENSDCKLYKPHIWKRIISIIGVCLILLCGSAWAEECGNFLNLGMGLDSHERLEAYGDCRIANALEEIARKMPEPKDQAKNERIIDKLKKDCRLDDVEADYTSVQFFCSDLYRKDGE